MGSNRVFIRDEIRTFACRLFINSLFYFSELCESMFFNISFWNGRCRPGQVGAWDLSYNGVVTLRAELEGLVRDFLHKIKCIHAVFTTILAGSLVFINWHSFHHGSHSVQESMSSYIESTGIYSNKQLDHLYHDSTQIVRIIFLSGLHQWIFQEKQF